MYYRNKLVYSRTGEKIDFKILLQYLMFKLLIAQLMFFGKTSQSILKLIPNLTSKDIAPLLKKI